MSFKKTAERLRRERIREQFKLDDRSARLRVPSRQLPPSLTAAQLARKWEKLVTFGRGPFGRGPCTFMEVTPEVAARIKALWCATWPGSPL